MSLQINALTKKKKSNKYVEKSLFSRSESESPQRRRFPPHKTLVSDKPLQRHTSTSTFMKQGDSQNLWSRRNPSVLCQIHLKQGLVRHWLAHGFQLVRVFNSWKIAAFEANPDYIRCLTLHPTASIVLTGSDDTVTSELFKAWDWDKGWKNILLVVSARVLASKSLCLYEQTYQGHTHIISWIQWKKCYTRLGSESELLWPRNSPVGGTTTSML